jgi:hypothetical protein
MQWSHCLQSWRWCLWCCSVVVSSKGMHKEEQNYTHMHKNNPIMCPKFKCNTVSVSFSACRCNSVILSSKVGRQRKKKESGDSSENGFCNCGLPACCCQPAVAGGVIYADLWGELALTWTHRLCCSEFSCVGASATGFPLSKHWERWHCTHILRLHVYLQFMWEVGLPPLLCSSPPTTTFTSFPGPDYLVVLLLLPAAMFVYSSRG